MRARIYGIIDERGMGIGRAIPSGSGSCRQKTILRLDSPGWKGVVRCQEGGSGVESASQHGATRRDLRVNDVVNGRALFGAFSTVRDAEVLPFVRLHLGTRLGRTYL